MIAIEEMNKLSKKNLDLVTVISGEDLGQYSQLKETFLKQIAFSSEDLSYSYFDMSETEYADIEMDLLSLPFFEEQKIIILDLFYDLTTDKRHFLGESELKRFEAYLEKPLESNRVVIFAPGKLDGKRRIVKLLKRDASLYEANPLKDGELKQYFQKVIKDKGMIFEDDAFEKLLVKSNFQFNDISKNILFLESFVGQKRISHSDIDEAVPKNLHDNLFDLSQFIVNGKVDEANQLVSDLRLQNEDDIKLISIMTGQFRLYLQVQILKNKGKTQQQMVSELSEYFGRKVNPYQIKYALRDSNNLSISFLKSAIIHLIKIDFDIKKGVYEKQYLFDITMLKIATLAKNEKVY
ncbi:DNA polymerase III, delta subunit [Streptococcus urinalis FB127-CNA-2]|uniref:DNA polymerase III subunit delta n=1 Tax=Streptococcus urinalis 2285-97 TaxID=764291 RepID=G5KDK2_9STRE|nr:DNA polymerase III subunit delta [Streptococcus urinalis]EHJ57492.1 DNA polymerase III, delta subunit [Streptococcus urinalis 2285-97]EKS19389.1 DNA polymerase III, delta subunit [Streptococcus urinalis FB127-CNA-2]VEF31520.1 DNA polymerase III subunit delta [Streptococcus urinalis]